MSDRITALQTLLTRLIDSRQGYEEVIGEIDNDWLREKAQHFLDRRMKNAEQIRSYLADVGEEPEDDGSLLANMHRHFVGLREALGQGDEALMAETVRGEKMLLEAYDDAIAAETGDDPEYDFLVDQYDELRNDIDELEREEQRAA